ncbi:MAG: serine/threonine-protein kinase [Methanoregula sp.]|jgi:serine/threonine-protein kinase|uniref:serine/threonine protein kinase n=1 Tax=Methanoregula sp. TaxID=2052170 RepID=UPI003D123940
MYKTGDVVCDYKIIGLLAQGGFSQIYKASAPDGKLVILKFPEASLLGDLATYERFRREVSIGQKLNHPAIPKAITFKEGTDCVVLVLEYIEGPSLRTYISENAPLPLNEVLSLADQLADTIDYLHAHGVYHRDLKPENVVVGPDGKIHILDFGSALLEGSRRVTWRWASNTFGTPDYMAPEQIQGKRGDSRTDVYALGMIVYEMFTGTLPFHGDNALSVMNQHLTAIPASPRMFQPSIPPGIEAVVLKSIRRNSDERYQSANAFRYDLQHFAELDLSQFNLEPEPAAGGLLTNRQIWLRSILIFIAFLAVSACIVLVVYLMRHR